MAVHDDNRERSASTDASNPTYALHDWLSVIMSGLEDGMQLSLIHEIAKSRAVLVLSSSKELVKAAPFARIVL